MGSMSSQNPIFILMFLHMLMYTVSRSQKSGRAMLGVGIPECLQVVPEGKKQQKLIIGPQNRHHDPFSYLIVAAPLVIDGEFETFCQLSICRSLT
ncbi:hypothetical protein CPB84DRAFT_1768512 [Gymnopilus junonius]|uniref:Secreted protein n=1 Tax=Gymnopilus junonius TaxID=109634 RepID=A0A9P5TQL6_GYMJU|nr:hypothetical protein CPB84DRAFT_1768512 [Gymnopilus junonius]